MSGASSGGVLRAGALSCGTPPPASCRAWVSNIMVNARMASALVRKNSWWTCAICCCCAWKAANVAAVVWNRGLLGLPGLLDMGGIT